MHTFTTPVLISAEMALISSTVLYRRPDGTDVTSSIYISAEMALISPCQELQGKMPRNHQRRPRAHQRRKRGRERQRLGQRVTHLSAQAAVGSRRAALVQQFSDLPNLNKILQSKTFQWIDQYHAYIYFHPPTDPTAVWHCRCAKAENLSLATLNSIFGRRGP